jgi:hypothetical protein
MTTGQTSLLSICNDSEENVSAMCSYFQRLATNNLPNNYIANYNAAPFCSDDGTVGQICYYYDNSVS